MISVLLANSEHRHIPGSVLGATLRSQLPVTASSLGISAVISMKMRVWKLVGEITGPRPRRTKSAEFRTEAKSS